VGVALAVLVAGARPGIAEMAVGGAAPDFELMPLRFYDFGLEEREITRENAWELYEPVRLSDFKGKRPVALVFGSYSAPIRADLPDLAALHLEYGDRVQFLFVYIREATDPTVKIPRAPQTDLERIRIANSFVNEVDLPIPCLVDGIDDTTLARYAAHPTRAYLVATDGRIAHVSPHASVKLDPAEFQAALVVPPSDPR